MRTKASLACFALAAAALPLESFADDASTLRMRKTVLQKPEPRQGHYVALGLHFTGARVNDSGRGVRGPTFGEGYSLRLGERITPWLDLGIAFAYGRTYGREAWSYGRLTVHGQFYPQKHTFVHTGFGFGAAGGTDLEDPDFDRGRFGDVYTAGVGYNHYLSPDDQSGGWVVTPVLSGEYHRDNLFPSTALWFGLEISYWTGIPKRQLDLDIERAYR